MAQKDFFEQPDLSEETDAMFYSRPLVLPGSAFGALNFFFDPKEITSEEVQHIGSLVAEFIDDYWKQKESRKRLTN